MNTTPYELVNEIVLSGLEKKGLAWFKPWKNKYGVISDPINNAKGYRYKGMNVFMLNAVAASMGYEHNEWLSWKQCVAKGGEVKEDERKNYYPVFFYQVTFWSPEKKKGYKSPAEAKKDGATDARKVFHVRKYNVYNIAQCNNIEPREPHVESVTDDTPLEPIARCEAIVAGYPEPPTIGNSVDGRAFYRPSTDGVYMPDLQNFVDSDSYYKTMFHELVHSTGHKKRLKRIKDDAAFGNDPYAREELVAEIGAMYLSGYADINPKDSDDNSIAYIQGWLKAIRDSNNVKLVANAMQAAAKAVAHILNQEQ